MSSPETIIRNARPAEAEALSEIERVCWSPRLGASAAVFAARIRAYPEGQWVAQVNGKAVGAATSQRIRREFLAAGPSRYDRLTDCGRFAASHDPEGDVFQLIGVSVLPEARGWRLGRQLVDHELAFARGLRGVRRIIGFTRPTGYHRHPNVSMEAYVALRRESGRWVDPVLDFHLGGGARLVSIHARYRPEDVEAGGYGVLIEYAVGMHESGTKLEAMHGKERRETDGAAGGHPGS